MTADAIITLIYGLLEAALFLTCLAIFIWGVIRGWELEILLPINAFVAGTAILLFAWPMTILIHDHLHISF
jgi:hypothetical protein